VNPERWQEAKKILDLALKTSGAPENRNFLTAKTRRLNYILTISLRFRHCDSGTICSFFAALPRINPGYS
jgi:hypothetical protein